MQTHIPPQLNLIRERDERHIFSVLRDRGDEDTLRITQNLLAEMLGAQRPSITNAARELEHAGADWSAIRQFRHCSRPPPTC